MTIRDEILASDGARELIAAREVTATLRGRGWVVREGGGGMDVAAIATWSRGKLTARVHLLVRCLSTAGGALLFSEQQGSPVRPEIFWIGEDDPRLRRVVGSEIHRAAYPKERAVVMPALVDAPRVQSHAANFRVVRGEVAAFRGALAELDAATDRLRDELLQGAMEDDAVTVHDVDLIHRAIVTDASLWTIADANRVEQRSAVRLTHGERWTDVVQSVDAIDYAAAFRRRRFTKNPCGGGLLAHRAG